VTHLVNCDSFLNVFEINVLQILHVLL